MSNRTVQTTWKNNAVQISTMSTSRTVNQGNFAVLACYFTSWKIFILSKPILHVTACDTFCEVYLWYDTNEELVTCSSVSWAFGVLQSCLGLSLCVLHVIAAMQQSRNTNRSNLLGSTLASCHQKSSKNYTPISIQIYEDREEKPKDTMQ